MSELKLLLLVTAYLGIGMGLGAVITKDSKPGEEAVASFTFLVCIFAWPVLIVGKLAATAFLLLGRY